MRRGEGFNSGGGENEGRVFEDGNKGHEKSAEELREEVRALGKQVLDVVRAGEAEKEHEAEEFDPETKFYFSTSLEHALDFLKLGGVVATKHGDGKNDVREDSQLAGGLVYFSRDEKDEDGEMCSGIDQERGQISDEVTFVFDSTVAKKGGFDPKAENPGVKANGVRM